MKIYLASRIGRRSEMFQYAAELEMDGHQVVSRWISDEPPVLTTDEDRVKWAQIDVEDVVASEIVINFTEFPGAVPGRARGGRHVEFGIGWALNKRLILCGPRENIFHWLPGIEVFSDWESAKKALV